MPPSAEGRPTADDRRVALVTGAGRGIGRGVAVRLSIVNEVEKRWGSPSVLVVSAGEGLSSPIGRYPDERWERQLALDLTTPFGCVRRTAPAMVDGVAVQG